MAKSLPPIEEVDPAILEGERFTANIPKTESLKKTCFHKDIRMVSAQELRCPCGVVYTGMGIHKLYDAFRNQ